MSNLIPGNHKHLTLNDRIFIEQSQDEGKSFREIAKFLCKNPSTISDEVWKNRTANTWNRGSFTNPYNFCIHRFRCKKTNACNKLILCDTYCRSCHICNNVCGRFERGECRHISKAPFVCNGCPVSRNKCQISTKYDYNAKAAHRKYSERLSDSRSGITLTKKELHAINKVVRPLTGQGQSPYMITANHLELNISVNTLYNYIDQGILLSRNIDLKRKVRFKPRSCHKTQITDRTVFTGRTYADFKEKHCDELEYVQMDTVKSARGSNKCILTFYFPETELFWAHLLPGCTPGAVKTVFDSLQQALGGVYEFSFLFPVILTDRGIEFGKPDALETGTKEMAGTSIFYCDPMRSSQKAGIENVHTMLRMIIPKGTVFTNLTQWDVRKCVDHINNAPRKRLGGHTPYELACRTYDPETLKALQLRYIAPDDVVLSPKLLKK